jgi:hypothetical protein
LTREERCRLEDDDFMVFVAEQLMATTISRRCPKARRRIVDVWGAWFM